MSTMDSQADASKVQYSKRAFTRTFVYLDRPLSKAPSGKMMEALKASGRSADITFTKNHSDAAMGRLLLASFPSLLGIDLKSLTFIKSYESGHAMAIIKKGLLNGEEIVRQYSSSHKRKIYFHSQPTAATSTASATSTQETDVVDLTQTPPENGAATRRLLTAMARRAGVSYEDVADEGETSDVDIDCIMTSPSSSAASNHQKDHIKVLSQEPEVVGDIVEDLSTFGFPEKEREKEGWGRLEEVAFWSKKALDATRNKIQLPPFMTHTLDEMLWQAREQLAVCLLILFCISNASDDFVDLLFNILHNQTRQLRGKVFVWVADSHSDEGSKVQAKYGVGDQTTLLVVVPSHIPQGIDFFNETTLDERKLKAALENAQQLLSRLENKRMDLARATVKGQEKSRKEGGANFSSTREIPFEKSYARHDHDENDDEDTEVAFGPVCESENLEETVEDDVDEGIERKTKKKRKKKKSKKNKKKKHEDGGPVEVGEPCVKIAKRDD